MTADAGSLLVHSEDAEIAGELLTAARQLAGASTRPVRLVAIGSDAAAQAQEGLRGGADEVLLVRAARGAAALAEEAFAAALQLAVQATRPAVLLLGATRRGTATAAQLAQALGLPCASSCISMAFDAAGALLVERRLYGGRFVARQRMALAPCIVTVPARRNARAENAPRAAPAAAPRTLELEAAPPRIRSLGALPRSRSQVDVTKAQVIVAAGRGVRRAEDLQALEALAARLGGVLAGSRPLTGDVDWLPVDRRIGLSGQTVKPNLYLACGISGQIEHIVGMKGARTVVAINSDAKAPIHLEADYSLVADLYEIVPALLRACEKAGAQARAGPAQPP